MSSTFYDQLSLASRKDVETAFLTLSAPPVGGPKPPPTTTTTTTTTPPQTGKDSITFAYAQQHHVITEVALPHLCRVMNLCLTEEALRHVCRDFGTATGPSPTLTVPPSQGASGGGHASAGPVVLPPTEFRFPALVRMYNTLFPLQHAFTEQYLQFFNLLDVQDVGVITQADLQHCLCAAGDRLSAEEFRHLLFAADLLHKPKLTVYEFMRILLKIGVDGMPN